MAQLIDFKTLQATRETELLRPVFPEDVSHFDDGTWQCAPASLLKLTRSFQRYGFTLNPLCTFAEFHERFSFVLQSSSLIQYLGYPWVADEHPPEMLAYLAAVLGGNAEQVAATLANIAEQKAVPAAASVAVPRPGLRPSLELVR